ncbi:MAG: DUF4012 domain-containing protein [Actinomycetota bacterium]
MKVQLQSATEDLLEGRLDEAETRFELARSFGQRASNVAWHPAAAFADVLPWIGDDVDAVQTIASSVDDISAGGLALVDAARSAGWNGESIDELGADSRIPLEAFKAAAPFLYRAADEMEEAYKVLEPLDSSSLIGPIGDAAKTVREATSESADQIGSAAALADLIPGFLGDEQPRQYFLAFQNLDAPRGTGGFLGLYGILQADDGALRLTEFSHTEDLAPVEGFQQSGDVAARYARFGGLSSFEASNYSPDFPTTARLILDMWSAVGRGELDGVIATDPVWMSQALEELGPVETPAWPEAVTSTNVSRVFHHDTFLLPPQESNSAQEAIGSALWDAFMERIESLRALSGAVAEGVRSRHLQAYSAVRREQILLESLGASGKIPSSSNPLFVVWQDASSNRAGFFARKTTHHRVTLSAEGTATVATTVSLQNDAPSGPPSILLGSGTTGDPVGYFAAYVNVYLPTKATEIRSSVTPPAVELQLIEREFGWPVAMELLGARPGRTASVEVSYRVPDAVRELESGAEYRIEYLPQPALRPDRVSVEIVLPEGAAVTGAAPGAETDGHVVRWNLTASEPRSFWVRWA